MSHQPMKPRMRARRRLAEEVGRWPDARQSIDTRSLPGDGNRQTYAPPDDDVKDCPDGEGDLVDLMEGRTRC